MGRATRKVKFTPRKETDVCGISPSASGSYQVAAHSGLVFRAMPVRRTAKRPPARTQREQAFLRAVAPSMSIQPRAAGQ